MDSFDTAYWYLEFKFIRKMSQLHFILFKFYTSIKATILQPYYYKRKIILPILICNNFFLEISFGQIYILLFSLYR